MTLNQYEKAHVALLAQIAKGVERIADAIETFNATDPLQEIERAFSIAETSNMTPTVNQPNAGEDALAHIPESERYRFE
jgi:hypothetical protein